MASVPQIIKSRQRRREKSQHSISSRFGKIALALGIVISVSIALSIIAITVLYSNLTSDLPSPEILPTLFNPTDGKLLQPSRLLDRSGERVIAVLENQNSSDRRYLSTRESNRFSVSPSLIQATIASVDPGFWTHSGFLWTGVYQNDQRTIAQELVADHLLWSETPSIQRDLRERILAAQITSRFGRDQILEWYLNAVDYGHLAYGADAAARTYFGKSATKLSLAEAAILAAASETPTLNPIDAPQLALESKDNILQKMFDQGLITRDQLQHSLGEKLNFQPEGGLAFDLSPAFTSLVLEQISQFFPLERITRGGLNLVTTLDYDLQSQTECTIDTQLARMSQSPDNEGSIEKSIICEMDRLLPSYQQDDNPINAELASNIVVLDPMVGQVLALVGGDKPDLDPTRLPGRPPGSILSPFVYLTSFTRGMGPATQLWDIPSSLVEGLTDIQNPDGEYHGPIRLRTALVNDYIVPTIQILSQMGPEQVWRTAQQLGLNDLQIPPDEGAYRLPLEGGEVILLELSQAYGVFPTQGILAGISQDSDSTENGSSPINPQVVLKVIENSGEVLLDCTDQVSNCHTSGRPVITPQLAYLTTNILSDETARWESLGHPNPLEIGRPAAAKIGRTATGGDTWTIGYTPDLLVGTWIGTQDSQIEANISPIWSAGLWHAIIQYVTRDRPVEEFIVPPGISTLQVCDPSGLLPTEECPNLVFEIFLNGNEPTHEDNLYQSFMINRETGRLATIFTSPALIDEKIFMVVPPEAESWASDSSLPAPPRAYDVLDVTPSGSSNAIINSPSMFSSVRGNLPIKGRASGDGFQFYRLQVGSGLNPSSWLQIGDDEEEPVGNGQLGVWDTTGLSGLYAIQLLVTFEDDNVESTTVQLTVDNQAPQVLIRFPADDQHFNFVGTKMITIQADASDDLELSKVEFLVDGELLATLFSPPYAVPWGTKIGNHSIKVRAYDRAGNMSEVTAKITVER